MRIRKHKDQPIDDILVEIVQGKMDAENGVCMMLLSDHGGRWAEVVSLGVTPEDFDDDSMRAVFVVLTHCGRNGLSFGRALELSKKLLKKMNLWPKRIAFRTISRLSDKYCKMGISAEDWAMRLIDCNQRMRRADECYQKARNILVGAA